MNATNALNSSIETAQADAAYFVLTSVWSYLNWMCPLDETNEAKELVSNLKRQFLFDCSAAVHQLSNNYTDKWRDKHGKPHHSIFDFATHRNWQHC